MAEEDDIKLKGFEKASVYRGQKIDDDYLKRVLGMTKADIDKKALSEGLGIFGKDKNTTKMLNEMLVEAGEKPYVTRHPILRKIEVDLFSSDLAKSKMDRMVFNTRLEKISNAVQSMKGSLDDKISYIRNTVKQMYPGISKASLKELPKIFGAVLGLPASVGLSLAFSPSAEAAELPKKPLIDLENLDFSGPDVNKQLLEQMSQDATMIKKRGGGMMNIDEMIRPIGMAAGGPIPPEDNVLEKLKKNDPDKELRDKGILPPLQERQGIMAQPAGLMEDTENFMVLGMKLELLRAADSLAEMDRIEKLNPDEIIREFEIFIGEKGA